jgi:hypothetical protein
MDKGKSGFMHSRDKAFERIALQFLIAIQAFAWEILILGLVFGRFQQ